MFQEKDFKSKTDNVTYIGITKKKNLIWTEFGTAQSQLVKVVLIRRFLSLMEKVCNQINYRVKLLQCHGPGWKMLMFRML